GGPDSGGVNRVFWLSFRAILSPAFDLAFLCHLALPAIEPVRNGYWGSRGKLACGSRGMVSRQAGGSITICCLQVEYRAKAACRRKRITMAPYQRGGLVHPDLAGIPA